MLIRIQTAGQAGLKPGAGKRIGAIGEDRRGTRHPEPSGIILACRNVPRHPDIGPGREQRGQPPVQCFRARTVRHMQDLKFLHIDQDDTPAVRSTGPVSMNPAGVRPCW